MVIILGIIDIASAFLLSQRCFGMDPIRDGVFIFSLIMIGKGLLFLVSGDIGSIIDVIVGLLLASLLLFSIPCFVLIPVATIVVLKGIMSLV